MMLTPTELERLTLFTAAELARKRLAKGLKLNHPEATALIADEILEGAREGRSVAELIAFGSTILDRSQTLPGVAELLPMLQVEALFPDGTKLVTVHDPIRPSAEAGGAHTAPAADAGSAPASTSPPRVPGEVICGTGDIELNAGRRKASVRVLNTGDRPIQVGSHFHFFEVNRALEFDRAAAFGMHLDIPAGTATRFEPGEAKEVPLCAFGGTGEIHGLNGLTNGTTHGELRRQAALAEARRRGFRGA